MSVQLSRRDFSSSASQGQRLGKRNLRLEIEMRLLLSLLGKIVHKGTLSVTAPDGRVYQVGSGAPSVGIRILDRSIIARLFFNPDMALGEAYMDGKLIVENGDIYDFLDLILANLGWRSGHWARIAFAAIRRIGRSAAQYNPVRVARANVAHHYNLSSELYELFLDADRQYSCAYYISPDDTLERAQEQKKRHLAAKLLLRPHQRVLDIGSGWGGLALALARYAGVDVTGVTLSAEQHAYSQCSAANSEMADNVRFLLKDYRQLEGRYDRIVSVGMFEHVGIGHYGEYFARVRDLLEDDGIAVIHTIGRADGPGVANAWINKYIFPGGYVPALSEIVPAIERAGLYITDVEVLRLHYAETLKAWRSRFNANRDRVAKIYDTRFCRMWEFYLAASEASFRHGGLINFQIQLSKKVDVVPLCRDYIENIGHGQAGHQTLSPA